MVYLSLGRCLRRRFGLTPLSPPNFSVAQPDRLFPHSIFAPARAGADILRSLQQSPLFQEYRQAFEATTGLPLVLREAGSFRSPLQGSKRMNPFCALMAGANSTCSACLQLQQRLEEDATQSAKTLECYAGLSESAVPVRVGDHVLGYLQTGQVFLGRPSPRRYQVFLRALRGGATGASPPGWEDAYFRTRVIPRKQYAMIVRLLAVFAEHLGAISNRLSIGQSLRYSPMITKMRTFITEHHREPLALRDAARAAHLSPFYFCKVFKGATGLTFTTYLARVRIEAVKESLLDADLRVSEAAFAAGFQSLSQFNRVFRRVTGEAPSRYRERLHGCTGKAARVALLPASSRREQSPVSTHPHRAGASFAVAICG